MDLDKLKILEFKLDEMVRHPSIVMIAKRGSGKSWITRDLIHHYRDMPGGIVISPTDRMSSFYKAFFPDLYIHYDIKESIISKILIRQKLMINKRKFKAKQNLKVNPAALLIMDDCLAQKKTWSKDANITEILMNGRHYKLTYILTMQYSKGIEPSLRLNFDYIFLLKEDATTSKKRLYEDYAGIFPRLQDFNDVFSACTADYKAMVVNNRKPTDNIQDKIFWFKAEPRKFLFGSDEFKELHKKYYDPHYMRRCDAVAYDANLIFGRKKNSNNIKIELV